MRVLSNISDLEAEETAKGTQPVPLTLVQNDQTVRRSIYTRYIKRLIDLLVVLISAPITVPVSLILVMLIRRDGSPAFYGQKRIGKDGKTFVCWKLRSMVVDADAYLEKHLSENSDARIEWNEFQKLRNDPRITPIGKFLRSTSLDELPQLWCVFKGEMSIVGPRPFLPQQQDLYNGKLYYQMRPGITGLWQVNDHNESNFVSRVSYDEKYGRTLSFLNDFRIMLKTVFVMLQARGR